MTVLCELQNHLLSYSLGSCEPVLNLGPRENSDVSEGSREPGQQGLEGEPLLCQVALSLLASWLFQERLQSSLKVRAGWVVEAPWQFMARSFFHCLLLVVCRALSKTPAALALNQTQHCKQLEGLVSAQVQLCRSNLELMHTIVHAAREVMKACRRAFADMRWNCSSIELAPNYLLDLERGRGLWGC